MWQNYIFIWLSELKPLSKCSFRGYQCCRYITLYLADGLNAECFLQLDAEQLASGLTLKEFEVLLLHGDMGQSERNKVITMFKKQEVNVLVATDVAGISHCIEEWCCLFNGELQQMHTWFSKVKYSKIKKKFLRRWQACFILFCPSLCEELSSKLKEQDKND